MKTSSHWRHKYNKEKQRILKFFIYVPQCENINIFVYLGGTGGGGFNKQTGPILAHIYYASHLYFYIACQIWKQPFELKSNI